MLLSKPMLKSWSSKKMTLKTTKTSRTSTTSTWIWSLSWKQGCIWWARHLTRKFPRPSSMAISINAITVQMAMKMNTQRSLQILCKWSATIAKTNLESLKRRTNLVRVIKKSVELQSIVRLSRLNNSMTMLYQLTFSGLAICQRMWARRRPSILRIWAMSTLTWK